MAEDEDTKLAPVPATPVPVVPAPVRCTSSGSAESSSSSMGSTSTSTNSNNSNVCSVCQAPVPNTKSQWIHRWLHTDKSFYYCKVCGESGEKFDDFEMLKQHEQIHLGSSLQELAHNIKQPLNIDIVEDESAGNETIEIIVAERIMEVEESIKTEKEDLDIVVSVSTSVMTKNNTQPVRSTGKTGQESKEIEVETEAFDSKDILQIPSSGMMSDQSSKETRTEPCAKCDMLFSTQLSYQRHLHQVHNEITVYPCIHCGQIFSRSVALYQHVQAHHKAFPGEHVFAQSQEPSIIANRDSDSEQGSFNPEQGSPTTITALPPSVTRPAAETRFPKVRKLLVDTADRESKEELLMNHNTLQPLPNPRNIPERPPRPSVVKFHTRAVQCHQLPISASQQNSSSSPQLTSYLFNAGGPHNVEKIPYDFKSFGTQNNCSEIEFESTASPTDSNNNVNGAGRKNPEGMTKTWVPLYIKKEDGNECPEQDRNQKKHSTKRIKLIHERDYQQQNSYSASRGAQESNSIMNQQYRVTSQQMLYPPMNTNKIFSHCHHPRNGNGSALLSNGSAVHYPSQIYSNNYNYNSSYDYAPSSASWNWNNRRFCQQNGPYPHVRENGSSCNNYHRTVVGNQNQSYCKIDQRVSHLSNHATSLIYPQSMGQLPLPTSRYNPYQTPRVVIPFPRQCIRQDDTQKCMNTSSVVNQCGYTHDQHQQQLASQSLPEKVLRNVNTLPNNPVPDGKGKEGATSHTFFQRKRSPGQIIPISSHQQKYVQQCNLYKTSKGTLQLDDVFYPTDNSRADASYVGNRNRNRRHVIDGQVIRFYRGTDSAEVSSENNSATTSQDILQIRKEPEIANIKDTGNPIKIKIEPKAARRKPRVLKKNTNSNKVKISAKNTKNRNGTKAETKGQKISSTIPCTDIDADNRFESPAPVSGIKLETRVSGDEPPLLRKKLPIMGDNFILLLDPKSENEDSMENSSAEVSKNKDEICENKTLEYEAEIEVQSASVTNNIFDPVMMANQVIEIPDDKEAEDIKKIFSIPECEEVDNPPNNNNNTSDKSNEKIYSCPICQKRFYSELQAKVHEVCMHEEM